VESIDKQKLQQRIAEQREAERKKVGVVTRIGLSRCYAETHLWLLQKEEARIAEEQACKEAETMQRELRLSMQGRQLHAQKMHETGIEICPICSEWNYLRSACVLQFANGFSQSALLQCTACKQTLSSQTN